MCKEHDNKVGDHFVDAFPSLFLPKDLPTMPLEEESEGHKNDRDSGMMCWKDFLTKKDQERDVFWDVASSFVDLHLGKGAVRPDLVRESLAKTQVGGYWAYHVRAQNAAVLIYRETNDKALFMTWQVQGRNPDITNNVAIQQTFPQVTVYVTWENLLEGVELQGDLAKREQWLAVPKIHKAGHVFHEKREVNNPFFVLDLLPSAFAGEVVPKEECFTLDKKICDEVRFESSVRPWRREPVHAVIKNVLHLVCMRETKSDLKYKVLMQRFLVHCLDSIPGNSTITHSSLVEASRKLVRRGYKLREKSGISPSTISALDKELKRVAQKALEGVHLDWDERCRIESSAAFDVPIETMKEAIVHKLPNSGTVLKELSRISANGGSVSTEASHAQCRDVPRPAELDRLRQWSPFKVADVKAQISLLCKVATLAQFGKAPQDFVRTLHDVSSGLIQAFGGFENIEECDDADIVAAALLDLEKEILEVGLGKGKYKDLSPFEDDVRGKSEVILVAFTICLLIDKLACKKYPLLAKHKLGVRAKHKLGVPGDIFENLFLPSMKFRNHLSDIETYLILRAKAAGPPTLEAGRSESSFAVQFARQCPRMKQARVEIVEACDKQQKKKTLEKQTKKMIYGDLIRKAEQMHCECPSDACTRCLNFDKANKVTIALHEKFLPKDKWAQQAVAFELKMPAALACQREALIVFAELVCNEEWDLERKGKRYWRAEANLSPWRDAFHSDQMKLGSTRKKVTQSHYKVCKCKDVVVEHGYNLVPMGPRGPMVDISSWKWDMSSHTTMIVPPGPYNSLQPVFNSFSHSENSVIAWKSEASEDLSLQEYEEVGCLRAGPSLQLERMVVGLQKQAYSLNREEIVSLFCCVFWQVGPMSPDDHVRESCSILRLEPDFIPRFCRALHDTLAKCKLNWSQHNILLWVAYSGRHMLEHADISGNRAGLKECVKIMRECRLIALDWIKDLVTRLNKCEDDDDMQRCRKTIVDVACIGTLSYLDCEDLMNDVTDDIYHWSLFRVVFHDNFVPNELLEPSWRRAHLLHCMEVAEQVAPKLLRLLETDEGRSGLSRFLSHYWAGSSKGELRSLWARYERSSRWFFARFMKTKKSGSGMLQTIQLDPVGGAFLIDGSPCARLPKEISSCNIYRRLFGNALFMVRHIRKGVYETASPFRGFHFEFYSRDFNPSLFGDNPIIIKERVGEEEQAVLVPDSLLKDDFPELLTREYSHWYVLTSDQEEHCNNLYFRPSKFTDPGMNLRLEEDDYVLHCSQNLLVEQRSGASFLDVHSSTFQKLHGAVFHRLSPAQFVHVKMTQNATHAVHIDLPRMHLSFSYDGKSIRTQQFGGLRVAREQNPGVFIGLKHVLLLEDPNGFADPVLLFPNGVVSRSGNETSIDTIGAEMKPSFYQYKARTELRDLKPWGGGRQAWLFLALLHAHTSGLLPDPFTGCTGTQRALDILRLGCCRGNLVTSTDDTVLTESLLPEFTLLGRIAEVSIGRENYHGMEQLLSLEDHSHPALCAHEGFALLARQRIDSLMEALHLIGKDHLLENEYGKVLDIFFEGRDGPLIEKAYLQRRKCYPRDCNLIEEEEALLSLPEETTRLAAMQSPLNQSNTTKVQEVGFVGQSGRNLSFVKPCLWELLGTKEKLVGLFRAESSDIKNGLRCINAMLKLRRDIDDEDKGDEKEVAFRDIWLELYQMARCRRPNSRQKQILFGYLLSFVAAHYPSMHCYLLELLLVARNPWRFPAAPKHPTYTKPGECDFAQERVDKLIDEHLEPFLVPEPSSRCREDYEKEHEIWQRKKSHHSHARQCTRKELQTIIQKKFYDGRYVDKANIKHHSNVRNQANLIDEMRGLFIGWRHAEELHVFSTKVSLQLEDLRTQMLLTSPPPMLFRIETGQGEERPTFQLATNSTKAVGTESKHRQHLETVSVSGRMHDAYEYDPAPKSICGKQVSPFEPTGNNDTPESVLCGELARALQESVHEALASPEQTFSFLEDSCVVLDIYQGLLDYQKRAENTVDGLWDLIKCSKQSTSSLLSIVGLWDSVTPWGVLSQHFKPGNLNGLKSGLSKPRVGFSEFHLINAFAVAIKNHQRARRCLKLLRQGNAAYPQLAHDISSQGCGNWSPAEYPEFLAFEIDNDICIREQQAQVAIEILRNDLGNRLLQLNMGCGKSAVIMPLVLCTAADGKSIARGTVLASLYGTNAADWQGKIGGLLDRQIFPLICSRDMALDIHQAKNTRERLTSIRDGRHVIVTVPEHRLSLDNKALEACDKKDFEVGACLLDVLDVLATEGRDFVDESDEIASPKNQLVYPFGSPQDMDGAQIRWLLHAAVLQSVSRHAVNLFEKYGPTAVEVVSQSSQSYEYNAIRLLDGPMVKHAYDDLCNKVLDDILKGDLPLHNGLNLLCKGRQIEIWKSCALGEQIEPTELASLESEKLLQSALCLRGLLSHGILELVLHKRFRVDYGPHPTRLHSQLAKPYRAKDVAAERTDFAHPDVCVGCTFATYYQSGLSENQLLDVFKNLARMNDAASIYKLWTDNMSDIGSLSDYIAINLEDKTLFSERIYPAFQKHFSVIDFWLLKIILPAQAKQYGLKLSSNAVDLFKSPSLLPSHQAISTGFSGSDDVCLVLPPTVEQKNLKELAKTNGIQILNILRPENNTYYALEAQGKAKSTNQVLQLLDTTEESKTNVALDPGAQVLHMSNEEFSRAWLKQRADCDACVFFRKDKIVYVSRRCDTRVFPFSGSEFEANMERCLLYLDDEHTRGSDFKLPLNARAVVTLGKGMNKDKFVQACMRMRQIGKGQQLCFVASNDVHLELGRIPDKGNSDVSRLNRIINWTLQNTAKRICDLVPYFVSQAVCSMRKSEAFQKHYYKDGRTPVANNEDLANLAGACTEKEQLKLMDMYIHPRGQKTLLDLATDRLAHLQTSPLGWAVLDRVKKIAPGATRHCSLHDEEQEVEREQELDEERQVERPPPAKPLESKVSPDLEDYFSQRETTLAVRHTPDSAFKYFVDGLGLSPLSMYFKETYFKETPFVAGIVDQLDQSLVFVTSDFINCVEGNGDKTFYLKRFRWIVQPPCKGVKVAILISNFEAEHFFLRQLRAGSCSIESFVPNIKRAQLNLAKTAPESLPRALSVFGGSINAEGSVMDGIKSYLGLHPSPTTEWNYLYQRGDIGIDGFVPPEKRKEDQGVVSPFSVVSPFQKSPVPFVLRFLVDARHLGSDMRTSVFGQMIELCEDDLETTYKAEEE